MAARSPDTLMLKSKIKDVLEHFLYAKPREVYGRQLKELIVRAAMLRFDGVRSFQFRGKKYHVLGERPNSPIYPRLPKELYPDADALLAAWEPVFEEEMPQVMSYISSVLNASDNPYDYLSKFPSGLRDYLKGLYQQLQIPIDGVTFASIEPAPGYQMAYEKLCSRVTLNLLLE